MNSRVLLLVVCLSLQLALLQAWADNNEWDELLRGVGVPEAIKVPSGQKLQVAYYAKGFQHYSFNGSDWVLFNATADLYPLEGHGRKEVGGGRKVAVGGDTAHKKKEEVVGQHFFLGHPDAAGGQPSWETFVPSASLVTARSVAEVTVDPKSITWALFQATAHSGSKELLGAVTYLQRLASKGGLPPSTTAGVQFGDVHLTPYSIIYVFYVSNKSA